MVVVPVSLRAIGPLKLQPAVSGVAFIPSVPVCLM